MFSIADYPWKYGSGLEIFQETESMLKGSVEKYSRPASEFAKLFESEIPDGLTVLNLVSGKDGSGAGCGQQIWQNFKIRS